MKNDKTTCTIAVNNFPRALWSKYASYVKASGATIRDHLEYLLLKTLREVGVDIPNFEIDKLLERIRAKKQPRKGGGKR